MDSEKENNSRPYTQEELERFAFLRSVFCTAMMPIAQTYLPDIGHDEALVVNQISPDEEPKFLRMKRDKAADIYEKFHATEVAELLREDPIPNTAIICFNAYNGFKAMLVMRAGVEVPEA